MKEFTHLITCGKSLPSKEVTNLIKECSKFNSEIFISCKGNSADVRKIMSVMALGIKNGDTIEVFIEGVDEEEAFASIEPFIKENL